PRSLAEPRYQGLLTLAPQAVGSARDLTERFSQYRAQLASIIGNLSALYTAAEGLDTFQPSSDTIRVLHVSDMHLNPEGFDLTEQVARQFHVDAIVDTGDINDWGTKLESSFVNRIADLRVPYVFVRGNHDSRATQAAVAAQPNAIVLDGGSREVAGLRFWGIGDPRFTPDKTNGDTIAKEKADALAFAPKVAHGLRASEPPAIDVALGHDPTVASGLGGLTPLVLAGHWHHFAQRHIGDSLLLVEGSTGGGGLRTLQGGHPLALTLS